MKRPLILLFSFFFSLTVNAQSTDVNLGIIPAPKSVSVLKGQFALSQKTVIQYENIADKKIAQLFHDFLKEKYFLDLKISKHSDRKETSAILFTSNRTENIPAEGYNLNIAPNSITAMGKDAGLFYSLQTLMQLFPINNQSSINILCAQIKDEPRFSYRGMHLDAALQFYPVSFIKKFIDLMAQYKLNTFHWHLTEDQGWRIEIKKYPELTKVGAYRAQTIIGSAQDDPMGYDNTPQGGFYTQDEIRDIVKYATARFITIIPEIEMPGHCISALAAYPYLACGDNPGPFKTIESWGIYEDVFCAGKETTFKFLEDVLTEVMELFPGKYIHIGGDEVPKTRWKTCVYCQKRIKDNHLKNEFELQSYFVQRIERFLNKKGRTMIGWDEILEGGLAQNATVMSWRGEKGGIEAAKQNHDVIMAPNDYIYFDHYQGKPEEEPMGFPGYNPLEKVYAYNPLPASLSAEQQKHIIGAEACVWTEYMPTPAKVEYMILPRMLAFSELSWTPSERKNYTNFLEECIPIHLAKLDKTDVVFYVPKAFGIEEKTFRGNSFTVKLKPPVYGAKIFYSFDDLPPRETDLLYEKPLTIKVPDGEKRILKTIVITPSGKRSAVSRTVFMNSHNSALKN
jgi:hexosaminidase